MPNNKTAKKRVLVNRTKAAQNKTCRTALKTVLKKAEAALASKTGAEDAVKIAIKKVDQAAAKGIIHKNNAAHKKSQLTLKLRANA